MFDWRIDTIRGKLMYSNLGSRGDPITRPRPRDLERDHGVRLHGRLIGANDQELRFDDDSSLSANDLSILWCTGLRPDYSFIEPRFPGDAFDSDGRPIHLRGVAAAPGLYFVGLRFQYTVASHDIYGVARDARYVAEQISGRLASVATARLALRCCDSRADLDAKSVSFVAAERRLTTATGVAHKPTETSGEPETCT